MNTFYKKNKLTPIINVSGFMTKIGASIVRNENINAATEVLPNFVNIDDCDYSMLLHPIKKVNAEIFSSS